MAIQGLNFEAQVTQWCRETEERLNAVFRQSAQTVINEAQKTRAEGGRMRIDTGFLRASGQASLDGPLPIDSKSRPVKGQSYSFNAGAVTATIANARIGDTIYFFWTASYAGYREYGANGQEPDAFLRSATIQWPQIVDRVAQEAQARASSSVS